MLDLLQVKGHALLKCFVHNSVFVKCLSSHPQKKQPHFDSLRSMPNTSEGQEPNPSGPSEASGMQRSTKVGEGHSLISSLARDAARVRRASSAELHLPWTFPVTHSREKFYTVCSDYALLNQAASVYCPPSTARTTAQSKQDAGPLPVRAKPSADQGGGAHVGSDGDFDMEDVSSKPILAWEIDTADFNSVFSRKIRTSSSHVTYMIRKYNVCFRSH